MTALEKEKIFTLLKTFSDWNLGYSSPDFQENVQFQDDVIQEERIVPVKEPSSVEIKNIAPLSQEEQGSFVSPRPLTLDTLKQRIEKCHNCVLSQHRLNVVPGEGVSTPLVLVIGEGPGEEEDKTGRPFVGKAGQLLDKMLNAIYLDRNKNCYIANIVKCRPPMNRTPMPDEAGACSVFLQTQIRILKPKMILALGRTAIQNLLQTDNGINAVRGKLLDYNGIPVVATYHPSALLRDESLKRLAWSDLKFFAGHLKSLAPDYMK